MRRAPFVLAATAAGLAGVFLYHTHGQTAALPAVGVVGAGRHRSTTTPASTAPPTTVQGPLSTAAPSTTAPPAVRTVDGSVEQYGYGMLQVAVTASGRHVQHVTLKNLQTADQYSQQLASQVIPMLRSEVLKAQSTHIDAISGATYTSEAYATSVQSALDKLHL
jgi:uncharacterized protein with FMN-binding domain